MNEAMKKIANSETIKTNIKTNITRLRVDNKLSKREVARALGMNENTYRIWEDMKKSCPKPYDIYKLSRLYKVSVDFILTGHDAEPAGALSTNTDSSYNADLTNTYLSALDDYEKLLLMNVRMLSGEQKAKLNEYIYKLSNNEE